VVDGRAACWKEMVSMSVKQEKLSRQEPTHLFGRNRSGISGIKTLIGRVADRITGLEVPFGHAGHRGSGGNRQKDSADSKDIVEGRHLELSVGLESGPF
jgi:hypothetical protein